MRFLAGLNTEMHKLIFTKSDTIISLNGVIVDENSFDYGYENVDPLITYLIRDIPYRFKDYDYLNYEDIIELDTDMESTDHCVSIKLTCKEIYDRYIVIYNVWELEIGYRLTSNGSHKNGVESIFGTEYNGDWYHEVWLDKKKNNHCVKVRWTGVYPNLCSGIWYLAVDGVDYSNIIPDRRMPMGTKIRMIAQDYCEDFGCPDDIESCDDCQACYSGGSEQDEWIMYNSKWLNKISKDIEIHKKIYDAINEHDFMIGYCGGCI